MIGYVMLKVMIPHSLYCHIPFCVKRCSYCDFVTTAGQTDRIGLYMAALQKELFSLAQSAGETLPLLHTLFFGGGTPSLVPASMYASFLQEMRRLFPTCSDMEISLEANPGTVTPEYLLDLRRMGFNRISFGAQSLQPRELALLGRIHTADQIGLAIHQARQAGFENVSFDLIFGLPGQNLQDWSETLESALDLAPEHISLYALTLEEGTPLLTRVQQGEIPLPDEDLSAEMYELATRHLADAGFESYEISNWAVRRNGELMNCRHNLQYWRDLPYFGLGAGAHGYVNGIRLENTPVLSDYIKRMESTVDMAYPQTAATKRSTHINAWDEIQESLMLGLRLTQEGVGLENFAARFGRRLEDLFAPEINRLMAAGLLEWTEEKKERALRLSEKGRILGNQVFMSFVDVPER
ncbi:MAG: radical SAM family heme chaperone HemW [Anaerolineae bacterium]|nr:radical SAM family heme chaperone HemW [Anaerolineae bacterium]